MKNHVIRRFFAAAAGLAALGASGCLNVQVGEKSYGNVHPSARPADEIKKVDKDAAYQIARSVARENKLNPDRYKLQDKKAEDSWWILFDQEGRAGYVGYPEHFAVRVWPDGRAMLYRDR